MNQKDYAKRRKQLIKKINDVDKKVNKDESDLEELTDLELELDFLDSYWKVKQVIDNYKGKNRS